MSILKYRTSLVLFAFGLGIFGLFVLWLPETGNSYRPLKVNGELTFRGYAVLVAALAFIMLALPHLFHLITRRPALEVGEGELRIWMIPYETIPLIEISKIEVGDNTIQIIRHSGKRRRINARILDLPRVFFFDEVKSRIANQDVVQEK